MTIDLGVGGADLLYAGTLLLSYVLLLLTSGYVVRFALERAGVDEESVERKRDTGTVVGKVENVLVLTLVLLGAYTMLGLVFAAKSIVRKQDMDGGDTTYYVAGTLTNFTYSLLFGVLTNTALNVIVWM